MHWYSTTRMTSAMLTVQTLQLREHKMRSGSTADEGEPSQASSLGPEKSVSVIFLESVVSDSRVGVGGWGSLSSVVSPLVEGRKGVEVEPPCSELCRSAPSPETTERFEGSSLEPTDDDSSS